MSIREKLRPIRIENTIQKGQKISFQSLLMMPSIFRKKFMICST